MNQTEPDPSSPPQAAVAERTAVLGPGGTRIAVAMLLGVPVLIWAASAAAALIVASR